MSVFPYLEVALNKESGTIKYENYEHYENKTYSFTGSGGYGDVDITTKQKDPSVFLEKYDVTDAVQVLFDVKTFNRKLGVTKDDNYKTIQTSYDGTKFPIDTITITASEFLDGIDAEQIIKVGKFATLYEEFSYHVNEYFNYSGTRSLFDSATLDSINDGILDIEGLWKILSDNANDSNSTVTISDITGCITLSNINNILRSALLTDVFNNRAYKTQADGFVAGDLIFVPNGLCLKLSLNLRTLGNINVKNDVLNKIANVLASKNVDMSKHQYLFTSETATTANTNISHTIKAPLLIRLSNLPEETIGSYIPPQTEVDTGQYKWINIGHSQGPNRWTSVALSASGMYQTIGQYDGPLMRTIDYGINWTATGPYLKWSGVSLSDSGEYQIACAYKGYIFISPDYGKNWESVATDENWSSVSTNASGKYMSATVFGGRIYVSSDYGKNWQGVAVINRWKSIDISFTGQRQTAVANGRGIYISTDYGMTWMCIELEYAWSSVALSSTGQYQTACIDGSAVYSTSDYGTTWKISRSLGNLLWNSVAVSGTGKYQTIVSRYGDIYISDDYGDTWVNSTKNKLEHWAWNSVATTFSGNIQTTVVWNGSIYISKLF